MELYYFDDEEGLARETSHPFFVEHATADFYYDSIDEFSPFGNDSGADALDSLETWYQERRAGEKATVFVRNLIKAWGFDVHYIELNTESELRALNLEDQFLNDVIDQAIVCVAFGQYKISGRGDKAMVALVAKAFKRQRYVAGLANTPDAPWDNYEEYIERIGIMEHDFAAMTIKKAR